MKAGQESSPQHGLLPFRRQSYRVNHREMHVGNGFQSGASASAAVLEDANSVAPRAKYPSSLL